MADKKISDFDTVASLADSDLMLLSSNGDTYNIEADTLLEAAAQAGLNAVMAEVATPAETAAYLGIT